MNVNLVGGDPYGGYCALDRLRLAPFCLFSLFTGTHVPGLYHIGASTHPGPGPRRRLGFPARQRPEMNDQLNVRAPDVAFEDPLWVRASAAGLRPSLGEIGLQQFAPYLINSVSLSWNTHLADALKADDMTTTKMRRSRS